MNKKIILTIGTLASIAAPVATIVSCGSNIPAGTVNKNGNDDGKNRPSFKTVEDYLQKIKNDLIAKGDNLTVDDVIKVLNSNGIKSSISGGTSMRHLYIGNKYEDISRFVTSWGALNKNQRKTLSLENFASMFAKQNDRFNIAEQVRRIIADAFTKFSKEGEGESYNNSGKGNKTGGKSGSGHKPAAIKNLPKTIKDLKKAYPQYYHSLAEGMTGEVLFNALNKIQVSHRLSVGSYDQLWTTYTKTFHDNYDEKDGSIYDIYSEKFGEKDDFSFSPGRDQTSGSYKHIGDSYNREHIVPQSYFGKHTQHIHNDAHFIYPTDAKINGLRSNYPHDEVSSYHKSGEEMGGNYWKLGIGIHGEGAAFEPDDAFKGDIARAYFYFQLTWHNYEKHPYGPFAVSEYPPFTQSFPYFKTSWLSMYIKWSNNDPVDQFNVDVNEGVAREEGGLRNPFVDMPTLITLIWGK